MNLPPAVTIHSIAHARAALAPGRPVTLLSAPGAALYAGAGWWRALIAAAATNSGTPPPDILDCAAAAGRALEALRAGQQRIVVHVSGTIFAEIAAEAAAMGAILYGTRPPSLDLNCPGAARRLDAWLAQADRAVR